MVAGSAEPGTLSCIVQRLTIPPLRAGLTPALPPDPFPHDHPDKLFHLALLTGGQRADLPQ